MVKQYKTRVRVAMIPLKYKNHDKADLNELMIDDDNKLIYIQTADGPKQYPDKDSVKDDVSHALSLRGISSNIGSSNIGDTITESNDMVSWINDMRTSKNDVVGTDDIVKILSDVPQGVTFLDMMNNKVDKVVGKDMVSNNYSNYYKNKLASIEEGAGVYDHPKEQQCEYIPPVLSVNGKVGEISIHKDDIAGLENVQPNANKYIHPEKQQCSHSFGTKSINGKTDENIVITKEELELDRISNIKMISYQDIHNDEEGYVTPKDMIKYIDFLLEEGV